MSDQQPWLDVNFCEIPKANEANGDQDAFELFARDLFVALGFKIIKEPARGGDDRKDIIVSEIRNGTLGNSEVYHLVSCKHFAHSKKSVGNNIETDIVGRLRINGCKSFIGFYSTIKSEALGRELDAAKSNNASEGLEFSCLDKAKIVELLQTNEKTLEVFKRHLPQAYKNYILNETESNLYANKPTIDCTKCRRNILQDMSGNVVKLIKLEPIYINGEYDWDKPIHKVREIIFTCNYCHDDVIKEIDDSYKYLPGTIESTDISAYTNPRTFIDNLMRETSFIRKHDGKYSDGAFMVWHKLNRAMFYFVCRRMKKIPDSSPRNVFEKYKL